MALLKAVVLDYDGVDESGVARYVLSEREYQFMDDFDALSGLILV